MRTLLVMAIVMAGVGGMLTLHAPVADAAQKAKRVETKRVAKPDAYPAYPRHSREEVECERARHVDPTGTYAAYPCWAREALGPKSSDW